MSHGQIYEHWFSAKQLALLLAQSLLQWLPKDVDSWRDYPGIIFQD